MTADVIRPDFGKKIARVTSAAQPQYADVWIAPEFEKLQGTREQALDVLNDMRFLFENKERVERARERVEEISDYIFRLPNFEKNGRSIDLRRESLRAVRLEGLCTIVLESDELQWQHRPNYFGAVALEYNERIKRMWLISDE